MSVLPSQGRFDPEGTLVIFQILVFTEDRTMKDGMVGRYTVVVVDARAGGRGASAKLIMKRSESETYLPKVR